MAAESDPVRGRGNRDPVTGTFEWYEFPDGHAATQAEGSVVSILTLCDQWDLVVADFASEYRIRLAREPVSWPEFRTLLTGLLATDSRLWRHFRRDEGG